MEKGDSFDEHLLQLVIGLQSTAWMALGKVQNPQTGKSEVNLPMAKDCIDTLLMLKEKTKNNLAPTEKGLLENALQELEINYLEVATPQSASNIKHTDPLTPPKQQEGHQP